MGKTAKGAVWLDPGLTSPYEYYQYWINTDDRDVARFLSLFTFLPLEEVGAVEHLTGAALNGAKTILAFEATRLAHGREQALAAFQAAQRLFGVRDLSPEILGSSDIPRMSSQAGPSAIPSSTIPLDRLTAGVPAFRLFHEIGLASSGAGARRLIDQGGAYVNGVRIDSHEQMITDNDLNAEGAIVLRSGKKRFHRLRVEK
jgi:tyrosyl-tRNA synthetase